MDDKNQPDRFIDTARNLGCDDDEDRFNETLKRIVPRKEDQPDST